MSEEVKSVDEWDGLDASLRRWLTPVLVVGSLALAGWSVSRALQGEKLGGVGSLLVLLVTVSMGAKLTAETYLFSFMGGEDSARQRSAARMAGPLAGLAKVRYVFGSFGGIIFPLGAQILATGAKNIPAATDAAPSAICAVLGAICLLISETAERRLFAQAMRPDATGK